MPPPTISTSHSCGAPGAALGGAAVGEAMSKEQSPESVGPRHDGTELAATLFEFEWQRIYSFYVPFYPSLTLICFRMGSF
jgi:hypothetical protein